MNRYQNTFAAIDQARQPGASPFGDTRNYAGRGGEVPAGKSPANAPYDVSRLNTLPAHTGVDVMPIVDYARYGEFNHAPGSEGVVWSGQAALSRAQGKRIFLLIQNTHAVNQMFVAFGQAPSSSLGLVVNAGGSILFDAVVPQNDVNISGAGAATTYQLTYCNQTIGQTS